MDEQALPRAVAAKERPMSRRLLVPALAALLLLADTPRAEVPAPPPPETYDVRIRYLIDAFARERVPQYRAMLKALKDAGFRRDDDTEEEAEALDRRLTRLRGTVPSA